MAKKAKQGEEQQPYEADPDEHYQTPLPLIELALSMLPDPFRLHHQRNEAGEERAMRILDVGAGNDARWGMAAKRRYPGSHLTTIEKRNVLKPSGLAVDLWISGQDFCLHQAEQPYDLILSNPPFSLGTEMVIHSLSLLRARGFALFLLPSAFANGKDRYLRLHSRQALWARGILVQRPKYTNAMLPGTNSRDREEDIFVWRKGYEGAPRMIWLPPEGRLPDGWQERLL